MAKREKKERKVLESLSRLCFIVVYCVRNLSSSLLSQTFICLKTIRIIRTDNAALKKQRVRDEIKDIMGN